jgi:hypothetical protein
MAVETIISTAPALSQARTEAAIQTAVTKKVQSTEAQVAKDLVALIPDPPLATDGAVGTKINTFA